MLSCWEGEARCAGTGRSLTAYNHSQRCITSVGGGAVSVCGGEDLVSGQMSHSEFVHTSVGDRHAERCAVDVSQLLENFRRAAKS